MTKNNSIAVALMAASLISGCAMAPLSERALGTKLALAKNVEGDDVAMITFSADERYETPRGVPLAGDPLICNQSGLFRVGDDNATDARIHGQGRRRDCRDIGDPVGKYRVVQNLLAVCRLYSGTWRQVCRRE